MTLSLAGCHRSDPRPPLDRASSTAAASPAESSTASPAPTYSPFVVDVLDGHLPFDQVTFKDVGMSLPAEEQAFVYESLAESVRSGLASRGLSTHVRYDLQWSDPQQHTACEGRHVYVDLWHPLASSEWGYSLWSGCGEESEFGRGSVTGEHDAVAASHPVGDLIANELRTAIDTGCFRKRC